MSCGCNSAVTAQAVTAAPAYSCAQAQQVDTGRWADYSPNPVQLELPSLPAPDFSCYQAPQAPQGQTRYLNVNEPGAVRNLEQNFNDVRTAVRENNTHVQRNRTQITNVNRNHNHVLRIVTNENHYEHNLLNNVVRVADIHRQRIENVAGQRRNFRDFKTTQRVENAGCRRADGGCYQQAAQVVQAAPVAYTQAAPAISYAPAVTQVQAAPAYSQAGGCGGGYY